MQKEQLVWRKKKPFTRKIKRPWMLMFLCQGSTNYCLKNPFELLELLFVAPSIIVNTFRKKLHWWERNFGRYLMKIKRLMVWTSHDNCIQELLLGNENSSLFKVSRFVKNLGTKLWVWHDQHVCYTSKKVDMATKSYHMETKGWKNNVLLLSQLCRMSKLS